MSDGEALLAGVIASPDEDAPRLVYADWLEEHGQADRAEYVRIQCELAKPKNMRRTLDATGVSVFQNDEYHRVTAFVPHTFPPRAGDIVDIAQTTDEGMLLLYGVNLVNVSRRVITRPEGPAVKVRGDVGGTQCEVANRWRRLRYRESELHNANGIKWWLEAVCGNASPTWIGTTHGGRFRRGFLDSVETSLAWWIDNADGFRSRTPLRECRIFEWNPRGVDDYSFRAANFSYSIKNGRQTFVALAGTMRVGVAGEVFPFPDQEETVTGGWTAVGAWNRSKIIKAFALRWPGVAFEIDSLASGETGDHPGFALPAHSGDEAVIDAVSPRSIRAGDYLRLREGRVVTTVRELATLVALENGQEGSPVRVRHL